MMNLTEKDVENVPFHSYGWEFLALSTGMLKFESLFNKKFLSQRCDETSEQAIKYEVLSFIHNLTAQRLLWDGAIRGLKIEVSNVHLYGLDLKRIFLSTDEVSGNFFGFIICGYARLYGLNHLGVKVELRTDDVDR